MNECVDRTARQLAEDALEDVKKIKFEGSYDGLSERIDANTQNISKNTEDIGSLRADVFGNPENRIKTGDDLNSYTTNGAYLCTTSTIAASLLNCPTGAGFKLEVISLAAGVTRVMQILYPNATGNTVMYTRRYSSSGWTDWTLVKDSAALQIDIDSNTEDIINLQNAVYDVPANLIQSGEDLNSYSIAGTYMCRNSAVGGSLVNCPVEAGFRLEVKYLSIARDRCIQILYHNFEDSYVYYVRKLLSTGWTKWYGIGGTQIN